MDESIFSVQTFKIEFPEFGVPHYLLPFGDVHDGNPGCHYELFQEWCDWATTKRNSIFIGMGDYTEWFSDTERIGMNSVRLHESSKKTLDDFAKDHCNKFHKKIKFMTGKLIGLMEGNHHYLFENGMTSTQYLCQLLRCKYLGATALTRLVFSYSRGNRKASLDVFSHHGKGASRLVGGSLNTVQQMAECAEADIYCISDDTEILTPDGWKNKYSLNEKDSVYSFKNGEIFKDIVLEKTNVNGEGFAYQIKNSNFDMLLSKNHDVLYRFKGSSWLKKKALDFCSMRAQVEIPVAGEYSGGFKIEDSKVILAGWIISEGSFLSSGIRITQKSEEKTNEIEDCISKCGYEYTRQKRNDGMNIIYIPAKHKKEIMRFVSEKNIPDWVYNIRNNQFDLFFDAMVKGDGNAFNENSGTYYSSNENLIDKLQHALTLYGYRNYKKFKKGGFKDGCWMVGYCKKSTSTINTKKTTRKVKYLGNFWCVTTTNGNIICRRNGRVFITGNCMGHDHKKSIGMSSKLKLTDGRTGTHLRERKLLYVRTGSFLKGYEEGKPSYVAKALLNPCDLGTVKIELTPRIKKDKNSDKTVIEIHASL